MNKQHKPKSTMSLKLTATFHSIGIEWSNSGGNSSTVCNVKYKPTGSSTWSDGLALSFDSRAIGGQTANEYRGSLVHLSPNTSYDVQLTAGANTISGSVSTWNEDFPVASITTLSSPTTITSGGSATGYKVYTGSINGGTNNIVINASYVIIRNMTLTGAGEDAIIIGAGTHDVIVEGCDISGWGYVGMGSNNQAAIRCKQVSPAPYRMILQRNKIHDSRDPGSGWDAGGTHALGPNGINWEYPGTNNVIRYNSLYQTLDKHKFMDGIGGADNFTTTGFPGADSDVYGNYVDGVFDDALEIEGGGKNVRVWSNFTNNSFTGISSATCAVGPLYIFDNVSNVGQRLHTSSFAPTPSQNDNEDRGPFNKCGSQDASVRGGKTYLFHNTILQPLQSGFKNPRGLDGGIVDNGGPVTNVTSINNIWTSAYTGQGGLPIALWQGGGQNCTSDHDLLNPNSTSGSFTITNRITGAPSYNSSVPLTLDPNGYFLASGSVGKGKAVAINNFNEGAGVDVGAYHSSAKLEFGVTAYSGGSTTTTSTTTQTPTTTTTTSTTTQPPTTTTTSTTTSTTTIPPTTTTTTSTTTTSTTTTSTTTQPPTTTTSTTTQPPTTTTSTTSTTTSTTTKPPKKIISVTVTYDDGSQTIVT